MYLSMRRWSRTALAACLPLIIGCQPKPVSDRQEKDNTSIEIEVDGKKVFDLDVKTPKKDDDKSKPKGW